MTIATIIGYSSRPAVRRVTRGVAGPRLVDFGRQHRRAHARTDGHRPARFAPRQGGDRLAGAPGLAAVVILVLLPLLAVSSAPATVVDGRHSRSARRSLFVVLMLCGRGREWCRASSLASSQTRSREMFVLVALTMAAGTALGVGEFFGCRSRSARFSPASSSASRHSVTRSAPISCRSARRSPWCSSSPSACW